MRLVLAAKRRLLAALEVLFPSAPDDVMAVADAAGVTATSDQELTDAEWHTAVCQITEDAAVQRRAAAGPWADFFAWAMELRVGDRS